MTRCHMCGVLAVALLCVVGCRTSHNVELEVKPMHITIDVNIKVDRALDDFFGDLDDGTGQ